MVFNPAPREVFFKRNEAGDPRWGEKVSTQASLPTDWVLRGYPDDEGIGLNGGRIGAKEAPDKIRQWFYKTTWIEGSPRLLDIGNLDLSQSLEHRHSYCRSSLGAQLDHGERVICLGGGHDYGFPDGAGFLDIYKNQQPVVINFDAHLDVRPLDRGFSSGTPFFRLLSEFGPFNFYQIGIQPQCNSEAYMQWCQEKGGRILSWPERLNKPKALCEQVEEFLGASVTRDSKKRPAYLSLDIDVFTNCEAPGCSQSWPTGMTANEFYPTLELLKEVLDIRVFGIYEVSPPLDQDSRTQKLAAQWIHQLLRGSRK